MMPEVYEQFTDICAKLEYHYRDMQDMEFTIEDGKLFMLQTRNGKRTAAAALKIACDLVDEGMISEKEAVCMIEPKSLDALLHPQFDQAALKKAQGARPPAWPPPPAPPAARSRSCWSAWRPPRRTSRACTTRRAC
jgi:pyruvate,orthophosphate dikinase